MCSKFCQSWQKLAVEEASRAGSKTPRGGPREQSGSVLVRGNQAQRGDAERRARDPDRVQRVDLGGAAW